MALVDKDPRSIRVRRGYTPRPGQDFYDIDWSTQGYASYEVYDGSKAWYDELPLGEDRNDWPLLGYQKDPPGFNKLVKLLSPIPVEKIYPKFPGGKLTRYKPQQGGDSLYFKAPRLCDYRADGDNELAIRLLNEAEVHERILCSPHPNLGSYLGCFVEEGWIVRLVFNKYSKTMSERLQLETQEEFTVQQRIDCMDQIEAAVTHLHSLGLAHNDISPSNIMFDNIGQAILIDFDSCAPLCSSLTKGGHTTGWRGPMGSEEGLQFKESSADCDKLAIQEIRKHLTDELEKAEGGSG